MKTGPLLSRDRAIPFSMRRDLITRRVKYRGIAYWVVKDAVALTYHQLHPVQFSILQLLDGKKSLAAIRDTVNHKYRAHPLSLLDVQNVLADLQAKRLVTVGRLGQGQQLWIEHQHDRGRRFLSTLMNVLYLRFPGWDPDSALNRLLPWFRWMFHPTCVVTMVSMVIASWVLLVVQFDTFRARLPAFKQFFALSNLLYLWLTLGITKVIHEFAHGLSCKYYGAECHQMGVMILVFNPTLYCDVTDSWMLESKWHRIVIGAAGIYIELLLSAFALFGWWVTHPGLLNHIFLNVLFITSLTTVMFNANPLVRFDGYYMLSDYAEIPNMKQKADSILRNWFGWYCLGIESNHDPFLPETSRGWLASYTISAWIYRWVILFSITLFLCAFLKPYELQSIGITLAGVTIISVMGNLLYQIFRVVSEPRVKPMSRSKIAVTMMISVALLVAVLLVPVPWYVEAAFVIQPHEVRHIYASVPGTLKEVNVLPGGFVKRDEQIVLLENVDLADRFRLLKRDYEKQLFEVSIYVALENVGAEQVAREGLQTIQNQLKEIDQQLQQNQVCSPVDGIVIEPPQIPHPVTEASDVRLHQWSGTPLDQKNLGCFLQKGTHILSIAPNSNLEAILFTDQAERNELAVGGKVKLKLEHLPHQTYFGTINNISDRPQLFVPQALSNKFGGYVSTTTDREGRERPTSAIYQSSVVLDNETELLKPGLKGKARLLVSHRSAAMWIWRYLRSTFHFRL